MTYEIQYAGLAQFLMFSDYRLNITIHKRMPKFHPCFMKVKIILFVLQISAMPEKAPKRSVPHLRLSEEPAWSCHRAYRNVFTAPYGHPCAEF